MKTATVRDLRNDLGRISKWLETGQTVQILKRGNVFARVVPEPSRPKTFLGACPGQSPWPEDIDDPVPVEWEADQ